MKDQLDAGDPLQEEEEFEQMDLPTYVQRYREKTLATAMLVIQKLEYFLTDPKKGGVPSFFNQSYDILFGYSMSVGYNVLKLKVDGPLKKKKERIIKFCKFVRENVNSNHVFVRE